jgi:hypothetical protein
LGEREPASVLLVDDVVHDGWTALTALGLVWAVLPMAQAQLWAGMPLDWREVLGEEWIHTFHPETARQMAARWEQDKAELFAGQPWRTPNGYWPLLVSGLVDGEEPLSSIPLAQALPYAAHLTRYLAEEEWLAFSAWVYDTAAAKIIAHAREAAPAPLAPGRVSWRTRSYRLGAEELIWAVTWLQRWSTVAEFCRLCNLPAPVVEEIVGRLVSRHYFVACDPPCGEFRAGRYYGRKYQAGILAFDPDGDAMRACLEPYVTDAMRVGTPFVDEQGVRICGLLLILDRDWEDAVNVKNLLYSCLGGVQEEYASRKGSEPWGELDALIGCLKEFAGVAEVFYMRERPVSPRPTCNQSLTRPGSDDARSPMTERPADGRNVRRTVVAVACAPGPPVRRTSLFVRRTFFPRARGWAGRGVV